MKLVATADLHGYLPTIPPCDVLVIAGDVLPLDAERSPRAEAWLARNFVPWLEYVPAATVVGIAGNHDFAFEANPGLARSLPWRYLCDEGCEVDGVTLWGMPWTPNLTGWAFYGSPAKQQESLESVPPGTMATITHSPPASHGDGGHPEWCSYHVNEMLKRVKPKVHISGHIHEGYGTFRGYHGHTDIYNVAYCDLMYQPGQPVRVITV